MTYARPRQAGVPLGKMEFLEAIQQLRVSILVDVPGPSLAPTNEEEVAPVVTRASDVAVLRRLVCIEHDRPPNRGE